MCEIVGLMGTQRSRQACTALAATCFRLLKTRESHQVQFQPARSACIHSTEGLDWREAILQVSWRTIHLQSLKYLLQKATLHADIW